MTKKVFSAVQPILRGFTSVITLQTSSDFWTTYALNSNNLAATFNNKFDYVDEPLWVGSTVSGHVTRDNTNKIITISIPNTVTREWDFDYINFDLIRYNGSTIYAIPGVWTWPVEQRVGLYAPS